MMVVPIFDGHNDSIQFTFLQKKGKGISILEESDLGQVSLQKMKQGGMIGGFFAIQVPPEDIKERRDDFGLHVNENGYYINLPTPLNQKYAESFVDRAIESSLDTIKRSKGSLKLVKKFSDTGITHKNRISVVLHLEGAEAVMRDLSNIEKYYNFGIRSIGLFWSRKNIFGSGVQYRFPSSPDIGEGLTEAGKNLVRRCNDLGIVVDLAHINLQGFWDVVKVSKKPLVVTHTNIYSICASSRNIIDEQIDAIAKSNGIIGINFEPITTNPQGLRLPKGKTLFSVLSDLKNTPISVIADHIDYIVKRAGTDFVGLGADMDGAIMPNELKDASEYQNIVITMQKRGYSFETIEKMCYKNWLRVIGETIG